MIKKSAFEKGELSKGPIKAREELTKEIDDLEREVGKVDQMTLKDFHIEDPQSPTKPSEPLLSKPGLFNKPVRLVRLV